MLRAIFLWHNKYLEALPPKRLDLFYSSIHIFLKVVAVHDGVNLKHNTILFAHLTKIYEYFNMIAGASPNCDICGIIEGIARDCHNIKVIPILGEPFAGDLTAISYDRNRLT